MGIKHKEQLEKIQKQSLNESCIKIIEVDKDSKTHFNTIEGIHFLKNGGFIALTGDVIRNKDQRAIPVNFLGHEVFFPEAPHFFALISDTLIFIFFSFRTGEKKYHYSVSKPIYVKADTRSQRKNAIVKSV